MSGWSRAVLVGLLAPAACATSGGGGGGASGGGATSAEAARRTIDQYLGAQMSGHHREAYDLLSADDRAAKPLPQYLEEERQNDELRARLARLSGRTSYAIESVQLEGARAVAKVRVSSPLGVEIEPYELKKERGGWRVSLGWRGRARGRGVRSNRPGLPPAPP